METITPELLKQRLEQGENLIIIDVREPEETALGMIEGAIPIPLMEIPNRLHEISKELETIFVCRSGGRSGNACEYLTALGYSKPVNLTGGMLAWDKLQ